jgi:[methyl-Co(III) methanol-specific corrinoid protein]:coenzyme M methyltransferase
MNQKDRLLKALKREPLDRPPAAVPTQNAIADVMEKSGFRWPSAQKYAKDMAGLAWACHEIAGIESVRVPFDINVEAEAMGCATRFGDDSTTPPMSTMKTKQDYGSIKIPDPLRDGRMPEVLEAITLLKEKTADSVPLIAALGTPFELLATTLDFEDISIIGPTYYARFSFPYTKALVKSLNKPTILHICGNPAAILQMMAQTGVNALSIDHPVDIQHAFEVTEGKVALVGKISPQTLLTGSREEIMAVTEESLKLGMHVVAPGCGIIPQTALKNLKAYIDCVVNWKGS